MRALILPGLILFGAFAGGGCGKAESISEEEAAPPDPKAFDPMALELPTDRLRSGRNIWTRTCAKCHLHGVGGAPIIGDHEAWAPRLAQDRETLYDHAINGFTGRLMNVMPPKGGFADLSDEEVRAAVDFVAYASQAP